MTEEILPEDTLQLSSDKRIRRLSRILFILAIATVVMCVVQFMALWLNDDLPLILENNGEMWQTFFHQIPLTERIILASIFFTPILCWMYSVWQIARLARSFRRGQIFCQPNTLYFQRIGIGLLAMGFAETVEFPLISLLLYHRDISPWLPDMDVVFILEPDLFMAGLFFVVLGKIMQRGIELEEASRLTV